MKKILLIFSQYRVGERIFPTISRLSNRYNLDCLLVYQMKSTHRWVGNEDLRNHFHKNYKDFFNTITEDRNRLDYKSYDLIISDDNRHSTKTKLWEIYDNRKSNMIGCYHGAGERWNNKQFFEKTQGKVYDYTFVMGQDDCKKNYCIPIGIPSNDNLNNMRMNPKHILLIVNFLGNITSVIGNQPFPVTFDKKLVNNIDLVELQKIHKLPFIIKLKSRDGEGKNQIKNNSDYIKSIMPDVDYNIVVDTNDLDNLIVDSKLIISAPSTLAYKPIQLGIPTILIEGSGQIGNFGMFKGLVKNDKEKIKDKINNMLDDSKDEVFIDTVIEGGSKFESTDVFMKRVEELI